jgi:hypothetical protein
MTGTDADAMCRGDMMWIVVWMYIALLFLLNMTTFINLSIVPKQQILRSVILITYPFSYPTVFLYHLHGHLSKQQTCQLLAPSFHPITRPINLALFLFRVLNASGLFTNTHRFTVSLLVCRFLTPIALQSGSYV